MSILGNKYVVLFRTGMAEFKAMENLDTNAFDYILPYIELTRGRKKTVDDIVSYPLDKDIQKVKSLFQGQTILIDVTSEEALSSAETKQFYVPENGYENWINFLTGLKEEGNFNEIIPTVLFNFDDPNFEVNISRQIESLYQNFGIVCYRNSIEDENWWADMEYLGQKPFIYAFDCGYVPSSMRNSMAEKCVSRISNILKYEPKLNIQNFVFIATSFPDNIGRIMDEGRADFALTETFVYNNIIENLGISNMLYGDYGSINPIKNDRVIMAHGWIPRIDVPLEDKIFVHRHRRPSGEKSYSHTYEEVGRLCKNEPDFPEDLENNWGIKNIINCSDGMVPSSAPNHWIAVRMNIHIAQQIKRLSKNGYFSH